MAAEDLHDVDPLRGRRPRALLGRTGLAETIIEEVTTREAHLPRNSSGAASVGKILDVPELCREIDRGHALGLAPGHALPPGPPPGRSDLIGGAERGLEIGKLIGTIAENTTTTILSFHVTEIWEVATEDDVDAPLRKGARGPVARGGRGDSDAIDAAEVTRHHVHILLRLP